MKKTLSAIAVIAALGLAMPTAAWAQETVGKNGQAVDGQGAGGQVQNSFVPDGFPNTSLETLIPTTPARINNPCAVPPYLQPAYCADFRTTPRLLRESAPTVESSSTVESNSSMSLSY
jgi:hypothetical protein